MISENQDKPTKDTSNKDKVASGNKDVPKTGYETNYNVAILVMIISLLSIITLRKYRTR